MGQDREAGDGTRLGWGCAKSALDHPMPPLSHRWTTGSHRRRAAAQMLLLRHKKQHRQQPWASRRPQQGHRAMSHPCRAPALPQAPHLPRGQPRPSAGLGQCWKHQSPGRGPGPARRKRGMSAIPLSRAKGKATWNESFPKGKSTESRSHPTGKTAGTKHRRMKTCNAS